MELRIDRSWRGEPLPEPEIATLRLLPAGDRLWLEVDAPFHGDPPPPGPPGPTDGLWEYEVVELFVAGRARPVPYLEVELGPHGHHLVISLRGIRRPVARMLPLQPQVQRCAGRWHGVAQLDPALLPPGHLRLNATRIHGVGSARRYLSSAPLPGPRPDFHQPEAFLHRWEPPWSR